MIAGSRRIGNSFEVILAMQRAVGIRHYLRDGGNIRFEVD
jgi:hypothetical protein